MLGDVIMGEAATALMPVVERFVSINGEGSNAGKRAAFIRFRGCNLRCSYCDTAWAWSDTCEAEMLSAAQLAQWVDETKARYVTLTGGEPLLQPLAPQLIKALASSAEDKGLRRVIEIETNGSVALDQVAALRQRLAHPETVQLTMDWKLPSSGMNGDMLPQNVALLEDYDVLKMVIGDEADLDYAASVLAKQGPHARCQVYVSPGYHTMEPKRLAQAVVEGRLGNVVMQLQLHKVIWPTVERGV